LALRRELTAPAIVQRIRGAANCGVLKSIDSARKVMRQSQCNWHVRGRAAFIVADTAPPKRINPKLPRMRGSDETKSRARKQSRRGIRVGVDPNFVLNPAAWSHPSGGQFGTAFNRAV